MTNPHEEVRNSLFDDSLRDDLSGRSSQSVVFILDHFQNAKRRGVIRRLRNQSVRRWKSEYSTDECRATEQEEILHERISRDRMWRGRDGDLPSEIQPDV